MNRSSEQKMKKETMDKMDLTDIFQAFHPETAECTFFSNARGVFSRTGYVLGHKTGLNKFKKIKIIPCPFSDHNAMKLEVNRRKKSAKTTNIRRLNNMILNNEWVNQEIKEEI